MRQHEARHTNGSAVAKIAGASARVRRSASALVLLAALGSGTSGSAQIVFTPIAVQGQPAPGTAHTYSSLLGGLGVGSPVIDNAGNVAFRAFVSSGSSTNDSATFVGRAGNVQPWAREGSPIPGGGTFGQNSSNQDAFPVVNAGVVAAAYRMTSGSEALVAGPAGGAVGVLRAGTQIPGLPAGALCGGFTSEPSVGVNGRYAAKTEVSGGGLNFQQAIVTDVSGAFAVLVVTSQPAPGAPGETLSTPLSTPGLGGTNHIIFRGGLPTGMALFSDRSGSLAPIYRAGVTPAPGLPGQTISQLHNDNHAPHLNAAGLVAFRGFTSGGIAAIFSEGFGAPGALRTVARSFQQLPPSFGFSFLGDLATIPPISLNDAGAVVFFCNANFNGLSRDSVFIERSAGELAIVARQGDAAPIAGLTFGTITPGSARLNNLGQVAFEATLSGPGVTAANDRGVFVSTGANGPIVTLFREGDSIDVFGDGSSIRTIASFEFSIADSALRFAPAAGLRNGHGAFNDQSTAATLLIFTDGTQAVFTATVPCITISDQPDPAEPCRGGTASFSIAASGSGTLSYQWRRGGEALADGPGPAGSTISGASTPTLSIAGVSSADAGAYSCLVSAACGTSTSADAPLVVCDADFNCDGDLNPDDLGDFINCFFGVPACGAADFNRDGDSNADDLADYINAYFAGCD